MEPWIQTYTRKRFTILNPKIEDICLADIVQGLSNICRFTGQLEDFYSVAQHSVLVSYICKNKEHKLSALCHDFSEAYLNDISTPLKKSPQLEGYRINESNLSKIIYRKFGLPEIEPPEVKEADLIALATEAKYLFVPRDDWSFEWGKYAIEIDFKPLLPKEAKKLFLERFHELYIEKFGIPYDGE